MRNFASVQQRCLFFNQFTAFLLIALCLVGCSSKDYGNAGDGANPSCRCDGDVIISNEAAIMGYAESISCVPGDIVSLYVSSITPHYDLKLIQKNSQNPAVIEEWSADNGFQQNYNACAFESGCKWEITDSIQIPLNASSGYYSIQLKNDSGKFQVPLIVRSLESSRVLCVASTNTWHAYNAFGGASFYRFDHPDLECEKYFSERISLNRPLSNLQGGKDYVGHLFQAELGLIHWLDSLDYMFDVVTDNDLSNDPSILLNYDLVLLNTHSEYWTETALDGLDEHLNRGGSLGYLGANGLYWKVTNEGDVLECQKEGKVHVSDGTPGGKWCDLSRPESQVLGVRYTSAGYKTFMPYVVLNESHWLFDGTNLKNGDLFGESLNRRFASGHETDKVDQYSPKNLEIIARGLNQERIDEFGLDGADRKGGADMVFYQTEAGGFVFATGSITSGGSMLLDSSMSRIVANFISHTLEESGTD
tara:strand:- start:421 stop:1848 length:1428 start_codon:yes stop_codon:yes gene_type:complete